MQAVIDEQFKALASLQSGDYMKSTRLFRSTLSLLESSLSAPTPALPSPTTGDAAPSFRIEFIQAQRPPTKSDFIDHNMIELYTRAICLAPQTDLSSLSDAQTEVIQHQVSAVMLYNAALSYHMLGLWNLAPSAKTGQHAMKVYQMALQVIERDEDFSCFGALLKSAILNNMAHLYSQFFKFEAMKECLDCLVTFLPIIGHSTEVAPEDFLHFQMNILLLQGRINSTAPCA